MLWGQQTLQEVAQHLDHTLLWDWDDLLVSGEEHASCDSILDLLAGNGMSVCPDCEVRRLEGKVRLRLTVRSSSITLISEYPDTVGGTCRTRWSDWLSPTESLACQSSLTLEGSSLNPLG